MVRGAEPVRGPPSGLKLVLPEASPAKPTVKLSIGRPESRLVLSATQAESVPPLSITPTGDVGHHLPLDRALDRVLKPLDQHVLGLLKGHRFGSVETFDARTMMVADD